MIQDYRNQEHGSVTLETVIAFPALILAVSLLIAGFQIVTANQTVEAAAGAAARTAALSRTPSAAAADGSSEGSRALAQANAPCEGSATSIDTSAFQAPIGQIGTVRATITCSVPLKAVLPGLPGSITVTKTATQPVDAYLQR